LTVAVPAAVRFDNVLARCGARTYPWTQNYARPDFDFRGQFIALWTERVNRFMARKVEPPTHYVQLASKAKKPTKSATTDKKKTKNVAIKKEKMTKVEAR
jgi:hypothetical protein